MKPILTFIGILLSSFCYSQSQIILKSGETIDASIVSLNDGILKARFKGNPLSFKLLDVKTIHFVKPTDQDIKPIVQATPTVVAKAELKGVITYYFNKNFGDKPDLGAKVIIHKVDTSGGKRSAISTFERVSTLKYLVDHKIDVEKYSKQLESLNAETKEKYDALMKDAFTELFKSDNSPSHMMVTADGNGNYSIVAEPGLYEVIFVSKGRNNINLVEINGKVSSSIMTLKSGETKVADKRFEL